MMEDLALLEKLCAARGVSGSEDEVRSRIREEIEPFADHVEETPLGNLIAFRKGKERAAVRLMLDAPMDEPGLIVTRVTEEGLLRIDTVGDVDPRVLPGKGVSFDSGLRGVIGVKPIHLLEKDEMEKSVPLKELYVDIGAENRAEAERAVKPGDVCAFDSVFDASHGKVKGRAAGSRAACALLVSLLREGLRYDATFVFSVQGEIGAGGARTAAYAVDPQAALAVGSVPAFDTAGGKGENRVCRLGGGAVVPFLDRRTAYDREYSRMAFEAARAAGADCQAAESVAGANDAGAVHVSRGGVRTAAVALPCRYRRAPVEMIAQSDCDAAKKIIRALAERISGGN